MTALRIAAAALWLLAAAVRVETPSALAQSVPAADDTPAAQPDVVDVKALIVAAAHQWGLDEQWMLDVAWCESRFDPQAIGPGGAAGVFQILPETWKWASERSGHPGASPLDAAANVEVAAWLMASQGKGAWGCG